MILSSSLCIICIIDNAIVVLMNKRNILVPIKHHFLSLFIELRDILVRTSYDKTSFMDKPDVSGEIVNVSEGFRKASFIVNNKNPRTLPQAAASHDRSKSNEKIKDVITIFEGSKIPKKSITLSNQTRFL